MTAIVDARDGRDGGAAVSLECRGMTQQSHTLEGVLPEKEKGGVGGRRTPWLAFLVGICVVVWYAWLGEENICTPRAPPRPPPSPPPSPIVVFTVRGAAIMCSGHVVVCCLLRTKIGSRYTRTVVLHAVCRGQRGRRGWKRRLFCCCAARNKTCQARLPSPFTKQASWNLSRFPCGMYVALLRLARPVPVAER